MSQMRILQMVVGSCSAPTSARHYWIKEGAQGNGVLSMNMSGHFCIYKVLVVVFGVCQIDMLKQGICMATMRGYGFDVHL